MKIIDQYIFTATKHLSEKEKLEINVAIRETIDDMLPDKYTENDVRDVLYELGNPTLLVQKYQEKPKYLVGPLLYANYIYTLKLVLLIIACVAPVVTFITVVTEYSDANYVDVIIKSISGLLTFIIQGAFQVFAWVTIIFALLDRSKRMDMQGLFQGSDWKIEDLDELPSDSKNKINKSDPVCSIIFNMILAIVLCFFPKFLGLFHFENSQWNITPIFNIEILNSYIPLFLFVVLLGVVTAIVKLINQRWTRKLAILNTIYNFSSIVVSCSFLLNKNIINSEFRDVLMQVVKNDMNDIAAIWQGASIGIILVIIIATGIWDSVVGFKKING